VASTRPKKRQGAGAAAAAAAKASTSKVGGRQAGSAAAVRRYLVALEKHQPRRGRPRTPKTLEDRLRKLDAEYEQADPLRRLHLEQRRLDVQKELDELLALRGEAPAELEDDFAAVAREYAEKHGITYMAWRRLGVPAKVLRKAGVTRTSSPSEADRSGG
jgi:hypothetical protein